MQLSAGNDLTVNRLNDWDGVWPDDYGKNESGFKDYRVEDYVPAALTDFQFELLIKHDTASLVYRKYLHGPTVAICFYFLFIVVGQRLMRDRKPFGLKRLLAGWNLLLAVYSTCGALRLVPHLAYGHATNPAAYFVCRNAIVHSAQGSIYFWISLFIWSKYFELIDTAFLVLRKKPVNFLHWFHHATVLAYTWHSMAHQTSTGIYFAGMNYLVHSIMYFYYFLAAVGRPPNWGLFVTCLQIAQMFAGIGINAYQYYASTAYPSCDVAWRNIYAAILMYTAYMALFLQFFIERYCASRSKGRRAKADAAKAEALANGGAKSNGETVLSGAAEQNGHWSGKGKTD
jgi:hypothetical protein